MENKFWKYGDNVLLISSEQPQRYLSARSIIEAKVYFLELLYNEYCITHYDNFSECFFQILPQVSYEAAKNLSKADENTSIEKKEILEKRVENENQQNQQIINQYKGKRIKIGDKVIIKHINSNSYIKFSQEKNSISMQKHFKIKGQQPILSVRLSEKIDSGVIFKIKIDPKLAFKKDGEQINLEDSFYFENFKYQSSFCFQSLVELQLNYKLNQIASQDNFIRSPSIMEKSMAFKIYEAVHVSKNQSYSTFKILLNEDNSNIQNNDANDDLPLFYGDYVRLKHILKDRKLQSYLTCDLNIVGTSPVPLMQIEDMYQEIGTACSIFQIVPKNEKKLKTKLKFQQNQFISQQDPNQRQHTKVLLRHWLTGKYLNIYRDSGIQTRLNDSLDESLIEQENKKQQYLRDQSNNHKKSKHHKKHHHKHNRSSLSAQTQQNNMMQSQIQMQNDIISQSDSDQEIKQKEKVEHEQIPEDVSPDKFNPRLIAKEINMHNSLSIISSQSDEIQVTNQSKFYFENNYKDDDSIEHLQVVSKYLMYDELQAQSKINYTGWIQEETNYEQVYIKNVKAKEQVYALQSNGFDSHDYFFFEPVDPMETINIQSALSRIYPMMVLSTYPEILQHRHEKDNYVFLFHLIQQVDKALSSLIKISHWMCDIDDVRKLDQLISMKINQHKQMIIQEIGLIDMVMKVLYHIQQFNLLEDVKNQNAKIFSLTVVLVNFLRLTSSKNLLNSYYIFQWYQMLKNILLLTKVLPVEIQIDKLLYELFITTKLNKDYIMRDDVQHICQLLEFEKCNNQALNLLLCFCNFNQENALDKNLQEKIINEVMAKNKKLIFKDFLFNKNTQKLAIQLNNNLVEIDHVLEKENNTLYQYIQATLQLACDISRGDAGLSIEYIQQLCPFQTCLEVFDNQNVPSTFRALFKNIFKNSFMNYDSRYNKEQQFPYLLKLHKNIKLSDGAIFQINQQRHQFELKYCNKDDSENGSNLKTQLLVQLFRLAYKEIFLIQSEDNPRITAMIEIVGFFLRKKFFDSTEIAKLHLLLDELIKNSYTFLINENKKQIEDESKKQLKKLIKKDHKFDVEAALQWLKLTLECLFFIELYEQDQMYEQFFILPKAGNVFSCSLEDILEENKCLKNSEIKTLWKLKQDEKKEVILNYMACLEIPDTEVIYYYLKILDFNSRILTQSTISMIYQIFSMRANILKGFNDLFFIYENNIQFYNLMAEQFYKIQIILVDLKHQNMGVGHDDQYIHFLSLIDESLNCMAINIFNDYIQVKTEDIVIQHDIDECQLAERHNIMEKNKEIRPKFIHQDKYNQQVEVEKQQRKKQEIVSNLSQLSQNKDKNSILFKSILKMKQLANNVQKQQVQTGQRKDYVWQILDQFGFDIRTASQKQDMLRHMNLHELITSIIILIVESKMNIQEQRKLSILETCLMLLIFFCIKNPKNANNIVDDPNFLFYIKKINQITYKNIQVYNLLFISELFKDNYNLLIKLEKEQASLVEELQQNFTKIYFQNINAKDDKNLISFDYCIYYIQLLQFFFKIKSANLIQNQVWIFKILKDNKIDIVIKDLLQQCKKYKVLLIPQKLSIYIPDKIILLTCFLGTFIKLIKIGKSNTKLIQESKQYISINYISGCLDELEYWYFLKLELLQFLQVVYIENTKVDETNITDLYNLFNGPIASDLDRYIQLQLKITDLQYMFDSEKRNIFKIYNNYSTKDQIIFYTLQDSANQYILFGIIDSFLAFCEQFFESHYTTIQQNLKLINNLQKYFEQIQGLWHTNEHEGTNFNIKKQLIDKWKREKSGFQQKSNFLNTTLVENNNVDNSYQSKSVQQQYHFQVCLQKLKNVLLNINYSDRSIKLHRETCNSEKDDQRVENAWDCMKHMITPIIDPILIDTEHKKEMDILIGMIVKMRSVDIQSFKCVVQNMIELLTDKYTSINIKDQIIKIVRHLANFQEQEEIASEIRKDLCNLGYTNFLCKVISKSHISDSSRFEYIIALVDFLDEGEEVQQSLLNYCQTDKENNFLVMIRDYILTNFNEFKEYEKSIAQRAANSSSMNDKVFQELYTVINNKIECCNQAIMILKMGCEGHFSQMQNHLREQINMQGKIIENNVNMVQFATDIFREYIVFSDSTNSIFGQKLLDYLIEVIQGPCFENQKFITKTKMLENLEDIMFDLVPSDFQQIDILKVRDVNMASFTKRIYVFLLSLFEGNQDLELINNVQSFLDPLVLIKRLIFIYKNIVKEPRPNIIKKLMKRMNGIDEKVEIKDEETSKEKMENTIDDKQQAVIDAVKNSDKDQKNSQFKAQKSRKQSVSASKFQLLAKKQFVSNENKYNEFQSSFVPQQDNALMIEDDERKIYTFEEIEQQFGQKIDELKEEGDQIFILLRLLDFRSTTFKEKLLLAKKDFKSDSQSKTIQSLYKNTMRFYKTNTGRIEIINDQKQIQLLFFAKPEISKYLSENTKENFMENVKRDQPNDKIKGLLEKTNDFIDEMNHFKFIMTNIPVDLDLMFARCRWIVLLQAFIINFMILFDYQTQGCPECEGEDPATHPCVCDMSTPTLLGQPLKFFGLVIFAFNILNFVLWAILKLKLDLLNAYNSFDNMIKEQKKQDKFKQKSSALLLLPTEVIKAAEFMKEFMRQNVHKHVYAFQYMCLNSYFLYLSLYAFITILGIVANRIFFTFLLLDIVERSLMLQNIMKSVTENVNQLIMMGLLGCVIMFIYAMIGYYSQTLHSTMVLNLNAQTNIPLCKSPLYCFLNIIDIALRSGGGVGEPTQQPSPNDASKFTSRFFYDDSFFIIVNVIWLNVIFGIIIDTFAQLREEKNEQDSERRNNCFICSLEKTIFEKEGIFFEEHTENQHCAWNYFLYIVYLKQKDSIDYTGTESFVFEKFQKDDISWFPIGKALCLETSEDLDDDEKKVQIYLEMDKNVKDMLEYTQKQQQITLKQLTSQYVQIAN